VILRAWPEAPELSLDQWEALESHLCLLTKWNKVVNLIGKGTVSGAAVKHYAESLALAAGMPPGLKSVVDAGSGAGFPGFPLAVMHPEVQVQLIESDQRKAAFLREACGELPNVTVIAARLESVFDCVDAVVTRAVDPKAVLAWGRERSQWFGYLGSTADVKSLERGHGLSDVNTKPLPWDQTSSALWGRFHVEHG